MNIPKRFTLFGCEYTVKIVSAKDWMNKDAWGFYYSDIREIHLLEREAQGMEQTFCHELMHAMLRAMGATRLYSNERFVDLMGSLIHQAFTTQK